MTPERTDQTANHGEDSPAHGIQRYHSDQHQREHHQGCAALPVAVGACLDKSSNADEKCNGEEDSAQLGELKPVPEPSPIRLDCRHA